MSIKHSLTKLSKGIWSRKKQESKMNDKWSVYEDPVKSLWLYFLCSERRHRIFSSFFSVAATKLSDQKQLKRGKGLFHLIWHSPSLRRVRTWTWGLWSKNHRRTLLVCLVHRLELSKISYISQDHLLREWCHSR